MKIVQAPKGMPVKCWAVVTAQGLAISGFPTVEAAKAWATEWNSTKDAQISPVCDVAPATEALTRYERHAQNMEEGEEWKNG